MSEYEHSPFSEKDVDDVIAGILHEGDGNNEDLDALDTVMDELNEDIVRVFARLNETCSELQFNAEEYLDKCRKNLPVSDMDTELFGQIATIVHHLPLGSTSELETMAGKLEEATKIITTCSPQL
jgi:hypothetical protein